MAGIQNPFTEMFYAMQGNDGGSEVTQEESILESASLGRGGPPTTHEHQRRRHSNTNFCAASTEELSASLDTSHKTVRLLLTPGPKAENIYTVYGESGWPLRLPPAFQVAAPFGVNVGGVNPEMIAIKAEAEFDSWLTVGLTEGDPTNSLGNIGIDIDSWGPQEELSTSNGAVFWMNPTDAPTQKLVVAQLTVPASFGSQVHMNVGGKSSQGVDWHERDVVWSI